MRFYSAGLALSVLLLLVVLTSAATYRSLRARRSFFDDIGNTLSNIGETIKDTVKTGYEFVFKRQEDPETTTSPPNTTTSDYRHIIGVPIRCSPNQVLVNNRCRENI